MAPSRQNAPDSVAAQWVDIFGATVERRRAAGTGRLARRVTDSPHTTQTETAARAPCRHHSRDGAVRGPGLGGWVADKVSDSWFVTLPTRPRRRWWWCR